MNTPHGFGLVVVTAMLLFYVLERRSQWFIIAFAGACMVGSIAGFLQGAWVLGLAESVWSILALRRWWLTQQAI
jgi:presenilin-like A22 family membrane protease